MFDNQNSAIYLTFCISFLTFSPNTTVPSPQSCILSTIFSLIRPRYCLSSTISVKGPSIEAMIRCFSSSTEGMLKKSDYDLMGMDFSDEVSTSSLLRVSVELVAKISLIIPKRQMIPSRINILVILFLNGSKVVFLSYR